MVSDRRLAANRANASKSTGPRTSRGKARSSRNGTTHGLAGRRIVLTSAERSALRRRLAGWMKQLGPTDATQRRLIERAAFATVILDRIQAIDEANWAESSNRGEPPDPAVFRFVARYDTIWTNVLYRALKALDLAKAQALAESWETSQSDRIRPEAHETGATARAEAP